ncbi:hypothetical protein [Meiothermus sp.]|uniref:hypothetical protein n=1 Tax=Meiothermus sp. TaxID=1955249 RepID=UPI00307D419A
MSQAAKNRVKGGGANLNAAQRASSDLEELGWNRGRTNFRPQAYVPGVSFFPAQAGEG